MRYRKRGIFSSNLCNWSAVVNPNAKFIKNTSDYMIWVGNECSERYCHKKIIYLYCSHG